MLPDFIKSDEINEVKKEIEYYRFEGKLGHQFEKDNRERIFGRICTNAVFQVITLRPLEIVRISRSKKAQSSSDIRSHTMFVSIADTSLNHARGPMGLPYC